MKAMALRFVLCLLFSLLSPITGLADGMVIPERTYALPRIPDQQALIHYSEGVETLVIETSFEGEGTNFVWIVPLPAEPKIRAISTGVFPTLQNIFQPRVVRSVHHWWLLLPAGMFLVWLGRLVRRGEGAAAALLLGLVLIVVLPGLGHAVTRSSNAGTSGTAQSVVSVLNRETVGLFDVTTLKATDSAALLSWLNHNGYETPTNIAPVVADYLKEGWLFAAARLSGEPGSMAARATHPLAFTFKTERAVYPLRLTAKGTETCRVDLYVFGDSRAAAAGFKLERCEAPQYVSLSGESRFSVNPGPLRIRHTVLRNLVAGAAVATKLSGVLTGTDMQRDLYLKWRYYRPAGQKVYTSRAAWILGLNAAALSFMGLVGLWWCALGTKIGTRLKVQRKGHWCAPAGFLVGLIAFLLLPRIDSASFRTVKASLAGAHNDCWILASGLEETLQPWTALTNSLPVEMPSLGELNNWLEIIGHDPADRRQRVTNFFTRQPIRFEASPGNIVLRPAKIHGDYLQMQPDYELIWHDFDGAEALTIPVNRHYFRGL